jgi:hypothetical protein
VSYVYYNIKRSNKSFQIDFGGMKEPDSVQLFLLFGFGLEDSIFLSVKQPAHIQRFCVILEVGLLLHRSQLFLLCVKLFPI